MIWLIFLYAVPSVVEAWTDRKGETSGGKRKDLIWLLIVLFLLTVFAWLLLHVQPLKSIALLLGWRVLFFDYLVAYLLIRNGVIVGHWFTYSGKTAVFDRLTAKVHPVLRLVVRLSLFAFALWWFV